jgi:hypothetical protein
LLCNLTWHRWTGWRPVPADCVTLRDCLRCGARESVPVHAWSHQAWAYDRDGACENHLTCTRCDAQHPGTTPFHVYEWVYDEPDACGGRHKCTRCGAVTSMMTSGRRHRYQWEYGEPGRCAGENRCTRCGDTTAETERHDYHWLVAATEQACRDGSCRRCAGTVIQVHDYRWVYERDKPGTLAARRRPPLSSCVQRYECANCGRAKPGMCREVHSWRESRSSDGVDRQCTDCSARDD